MTARTIEVSGLKIGRGNPIALIAGPCVIESQQLLMETAGSIKELCNQLDMPFIFKSSFLKDNRSSVDYFQGPGLEKGLEMLAQVRAEFSVPILSDIHNPEQARLAGEVLDIIQIPAYLSMQTSIAVEAAATGKIINVKKGQFLHPEDMGKVVRKIESAGNNNILLTERGTCLGYHNLVVDMRSIPMMQATGYPVVFDVTHAIRVYGVPSSDSAGGAPEYVPVLARAGVAAGCDAIFIETHPDPRNALCDAASMWPLHRLEELLIQVKEINEVVSRTERVLLT